MHKPVTLLEMALSTPLRPLRPPLMLLRALALQPRQPRSRQPHRLAALLHQLALGLLAVEVEVDRATPRLIVALPCTVT